MIVGGLSWWQSWLCVWLGYAIAGCFVCLTGRIGATYHIGFPVVARSSFGIWGSLWPVFNRAAMGACLPPSPRMSISRLTGRQLACGMACSRISEDTVFT